MSVNKTIGLSIQAQSLWGKTDGSGGRYWLPLYVHMADSVGVGARLWDEWLPEGTREAIAGAYDQDVARSLFLLLAGWHDIGKATPVFQAKPCRFGASYSSEGYSMSWKPRKAGLPVRDDLARRGRPTHPAAGQAIVGRFLRTKWSWKRVPAKSVECVIGNHHGRPSDANADKDMRPGGSLEIEMGYDQACKGQWEKVQEELLGFVLSLCDADSLEQIYLSPQAASLMTGLLIMTDWIASNQDLFPLEPACPWEDDDGEPLGLMRDGAFDLSAHEHRVSAAWESLGMAPSWQEGYEECSAESLFSERFALPEDARLRPVQKDAVKIAQTTKDPGLIVIEAPMGEGKTEAALAAAEILAERTGRGGVCVALPTMATTDAMFGRVHEWLDRLPDDGGERTMFLAHGKARLNEEYQGIVRSSRQSHVGVGVDLGEKGEEGVVASEWMSGRKRGMLSNFVVCTVDQVLMGALAMKHLPLRQLALANKVVIIDECHAYDAYMNNYLRRILQWLGSMGTPVVLLSATLPESQRKEMVVSYLEGRSVLSYRYSREGGKEEEPSIAAGPGAYPLITFTSGMEASYLSSVPSGRSLGVGVRVMGDGLEELGDLLDRMLYDGGCAGVICDTVKRSQAVAAALRERFGEDGVILSHARFTDLDRMANERVLRELLGPKATRANRKRPWRLVVVGTQVLEQSLDIDFDLLVTDMAPIDLLMQRIGRLHRHARGQGEGDRPLPLRKATCYIRGISEWRDCGPGFDRGVKTVYREASLLEALSVLGLLSQDAACGIELPSDIASMVRRAYQTPDDLTKVPTEWVGSYELALDARGKEEVNENNRAQYCLLKSVKSMCWNNQTLSNWYRASGDAGSRDGDWGPRAVRDTQETVEVLLLERRDGEVHLLPWVSDLERDIPAGATVPTLEVPDDEIARLVAQCSIRLPIELCRPDAIDGLIAELERECVSQTALWQESPWLAGQLALFLERDDEGRLQGSVCGRMVAYSHRDGLSVI